MAAIISMVPVLIAVAGCAARAPGGPVGTGAASPAGGAAADAAPSRYATVVAIPAGGQNPQAAIPNPGTGTGPQAYDGWTSGLWTVAVASFNLPGVQLAVTRQAVPTTLGPPSFSEAIITGPPSVLDAMGDPPLPPECRVITSQPYSGGVVPIAATRPGPGSPRTRAS